MEYDLFEILIVWIFNAPNISIIDGVEIKAYHLFSFVILFHNAEKPFQSPVEF